MIKSCCWCCWCDGNLFVEGIRYLFSSSLPLNTKFTFSNPPTKPWIAWSVCSGIFHSVNSNNCFRMHWYLYRFLLRLSWRSFESRKSWKGLNFYNIITKRMMFPLDLTRSGRNWKRGGEFNFTPWPRRPQGDPIFQSRQRRQRIGRCNNFLTLIRTISNSLSGYFRGTDDRVLRKSI